MPLKSSNSCPRMVAESHKSYHGIKGKNPLISEIYSDKEVNKKFWVNHLDQL